MYIKRFNESIEQDIPQKTLDIINEISEVFENVRDNFINFEDSGMLSEYRFIIRRGELFTSTSVVYSPIGFSTKRQNVTKERFIESSSSFYLHVSDSVKYKKFLGVEVHFPSGSNGIIDSDGIKLFDDIVEINNRLSEKYKVYLDMNGNHFGYKPMKFYIGFDLNI